MLFGVELSMWQGLASITYGDMYFREIGCLRSLRRSRVSKYDRLIQKGQPLSYSSELPKYRQVLAYAGKIKA